MKVVCIDDSEQSLVNIPKVQKGYIYTVIESFFFKERTIGGVRYLKGTYYILIEFGNGIGFHESMFIKINESDIDETEFDRNYKKELL